MKNYTTKENIELYLGEDIDDNLDLYILSAENVIDNYTNRNFVADAEDTERTYDGNNKNELLIDPAVEISKIEIDGEEKEFITYPYNSTPIIKVIMEDDYFPYDYKNITITGKWGWSECPPDDIKLVATELASKMYKGNIKTNITSESIGDYSVNYKNDEENKSLSSVKMILDKYKQL
jgi:hypothetical protein